MIQRNFFAATLAVGAMVLASSSFAATGDAGCGLGSMIISGNTKGLQLLAMTTNSSSGSQLFGITSGTSNCSSRGLVQREKAIQYFVETHHEDLGHELAAGRGERLSTLASLYGCENSQAQAQFGGVVQSHLSDIYPSASVAPTTLHNNINRVVSSRSDQLAACELAL